MNLRFEILARDGPARRGRLTLTHGTVETPAFMAVGTYGSVKAMSPDDLALCRAQVVLGQHLSLWLRPGLEVIRAHNGCTFHGAGRADPHRFRRLPGFSLGGMRKIPRRRQIPLACQRRCVFPVTRRSMRIQGVLDADIAHDFR